jgi:hypothetical protein
MLTEKEYKQFKIGTYILVGAFCLSVLLLNIFVN